MLILMGEQGKTVGASVPGRPPIGLDQDAGGHRGPPLQILWPSIISIMTE